MWLRFAVTVLATRAFGVPVYRHWSLDAGTRHQSSEGHRQSLQTSNASAPATPEQQQQHQMRYSPDAVLRCLRKHRYTPLACRTPTDSMVGLRSPPRSPPPRYCGHGSFGNVCHHGRGTCNYDHVRGWHCACVKVVNDAIRGYARSTRHDIRVAPDCLES